MVKLFNVNHNQAPLRRKFVGYSNDRTKWKNDEEDFDFSHHKIDIFFVIICLLLLCIGLLFTYSSSALETSSFFIKQLVFDFIGIVVAIVLTFSYSKLQQLKAFSPIYLVYVTWLLLIIVLFTRTQAHVHRWIDFGFFKFQPSELAKITLVIYLADYLSKVIGNLQKNSKLLIKPVIIAMITIGLIAAGKDLGTPALIFAVTVVMLFVAGMRWAWLFTLFGLGTVGVVGMIFKSPYRVARLFSFLNPFANVKGVGYQLVQSLLAIASGGWLGKGLGNSELKLEYLPAAHTDFIFAVVCEEFGFIRVLIFVILPFCCLFIRGIQLAKLAPSNFNSLVILGLTLTICGQAFFNMAMTLGLTPTKGIALPFLSYGGSSAIMTLAMVGIILNLATDRSKNSNARIEKFNNRNR